MFRLWGKIFKDNHLLQDEVICIEDETMSRTAKVFEAVRQLSYTFDLSQPIWLDVTVRDFKRHDKTRFHQDNFVEPIDFDFLEIHVIEE